jgi:isopentenyl diphosphate isomerase/L-lactate dehydrogenase-like FMN-dependent dehydrogenase
LDVPAQAKAKRLTLGREPPPTSCKAARVDDPVNVWDYERLAEEKLEPGAFGYYAGGAGDEWTLRENVEAFRRWVLRPRVLVDVGSVTTATTVLGTEIALPVLVAPTAFHRLAHPDGELATARAADRAGTIMCLSTLSTAAPAEIAEAAPGGRLWYQLYWHPDRGITRTLVERAAAAGFRAIVLTVDLPVLGNRERDLRTGFVLPDDLEPAFASATPEAAEVGSEVLGLWIDPRISWKDLEWLRSLSDLPLLVKGVLTAEDAILACEHGCDGIIVSNHGGRQLDRVPASLDALPEVVEAVGDRCEILMDGGIRRGIDVVTALALGAKAVLAGRAVLWGLAARGEEGASHVLELLRAETEMALALLGCTSPDQLTRAHVAPARLD